MTQHRLQAIGMRMVMMIGGEAMQSGLHFAFNVVLVHLLSQKDFGIFAILLVIGGLGLTYVRSLTALPGSIAIKRSATPWAMERNEACFSAAALLLSMAIGIIVAIILDLWIEDGALAGAMLIAAWCMRSHLRITSFAANRQRLVMISDMLFTAAGALGLLLVLVSPAEEILNQAIEALAFANAISLGMLCVGGGLIRLRFGAPLRRRYLVLWRKLGWSLLSVTMTNLQGQSVALIVTAMRGPEAYAPFATVLIAFVPLRVSVTALVNMLQPEASNLIAGRKWERLSAYCRNWTVMVTLFAIVYGGAVCIILEFLTVPTLVDEPVFAIAVLTAASATAMMLYMMPRLSLEAALAFKTLLIITTIAAALGASLIFCILTYGSEAYAIAGGACAEAAVAVGCWIALRRMIDGRSHQELSLSRA